MGWNIKYQNRVKKKSVRWRLQMSLFVRPTEFQKVFYLQLLLKLWIMCKCVNVKVILCAVVQLKQPLTALWIMAAATTSVRRARTAWQGAAAASPDTNCTTTQGNVCRKVRKHLTDGRISLTAHTRLFLTHRSRPWKLQGHSILLLSMKKYSSTDIRCYSSIYTVGLGLSTPGGTSTLILCTFAVTRGYVDRM